MKRILHKASIFLIGTLFSLSMILYPMESKAQTTTTYMTASATSLSVTHTHSSSSGTHDGTACWYSYTVSVPYSYTTVETQSYSYQCTGGAGYHSDDGVNLWCNACGACLAYGAHNTLSGTRQVEVTHTGTKTETRYAISDSTYNTTTPFVSMTLSCADTDAYDGKAILTCDITEGGYFEKWAWSDENQVVWSSATNGGGTIYGYGTELEITSTGTYYCTFLGSASGFTISGKTQAITVNGTNVNVSKIFVGDCRIREFNKDTYAYDKTIRIGDVVISKIYIGDTLIHDDSLYR